MPALSESKPHQDRLDELIGVALAMQKLFGKDVANTGQVITLFHTIFAKYPGEKVIRAMQIWLERSQEFPTPADIISIIKRNGRRPLDRSVYIQISKKEPDQRTAQDWKYMQDYEAAMNEDDFGSEYEDHEKTQDLLRENIRLREEVKALKEENARAWAYKKPGQAPAIPTQQEKALKTIEVMRSEGANPEDIKAFAEQFGIEVVL